MTKCHCEEERSDDVAISQDDFKTNIPGQNPPGF